jgi:DNA-binding PadR family transcriptional regulator
VLELAILGNLKQAPVHGYELKKRLADTLGPLWGVSFGSLYPALRRLERSGAIEVVDAQEEAPAIPSTGSLRGEAATARLRLAPKTSRRARKAYRITARGEALFSELLRDPDGAVDDRTFALQLSFFRFLEPTDRLELLQRRRAELADRLARSRRNRTPALDRYTRSLAEHRTDSVERDLAWIDALIDGERRPAPSTEPTDRPQEQEQGATA